MISQQVLGAECAAPNKTPGTPPIHACTAPQHPIRDCPSPFTHALLHCIPSACGHGLEWAAAHSSSIRLGCDAWCMHTLPTIQKLLSQLGLTHEDAGMQPPSTTRSPSRPPWLTDYSQTTCYDHLPCILFPINADAQTQATCQATCNMNCPAAVGLHGLGNPQPCHAMPCHAMPCHALSCSTFTIGTPHPLTASDCCHCFYCPSERPTKFAPPALMPTSLALRRRADSKQPQR
jgi:hypothetical protein